MDHFNYHNNELYAEGVPVARIAERFGTPCYIYSRATLERHWHAFDQALGSHPHLICYAVKANSTQALLNLFARLGSGFDIVSGGELERVLAAGGDPKKVVFSGVGKQKAEIMRALAVGIGCFNVESASELMRLNEIAVSMGLKAPVSLRINPDVDAKTHPYIATGLKENKFGIATEEAIALYLEANQMPGIEIVGIDCHIGSQLTELTPFLLALDALLVIVAQLSAHGIQLRHLDLGGGLGAPYGIEHPPHPSAYAKAIFERLRNCPLTIVLEPGRAIAANAGILVTRVEYLKTTADKQFAIVDAGMNDLLRPALYSAWQAIIPVQPRDTKKAQLYDIVGPVCETADFLGKERLLALAQDDLLAVRSAGAYGFSMSSNYNTRPRAAEIMVDGETEYLIRPRETMADLFGRELCLP